MHCPFVCISLFITSDKDSNGVYISLRRFKFKRLKILFTVLVSWHGSFGNAEQCNDEDTDQHQGFHPRYLLSSSCV
jgi:hypothetical protein